MAFLQLRILSQSINLLIYYSVNQELCLPDTGLNDCINMNIFSMNLVIVFLVPSFFASTLSSIQ